MQKRTWRFRSIRGDAAEVMASARTMTEAARRLGVDRSSLHRWVQAGKVPALTGKKPRRTLPDAAPAAREAQTPEAWADDVRARYDLSATEYQLVDLAVIARRMADDGAQAPAIRLQAAARFAALVRQLDLETEATLGETEAATVRPWPRRVG